MKEHPHLTRLLTEGTFETYVAGRGSFTLTFCNHCAQCLVDDLSDVSDLKDVVYVIQHTRCKICMERIKALLR